MLRRCLKSLVNRIRRKIESRKSEVHKDEETPRLPEQLIMDEILPRLPVKSLLKFRCVSKPWCSLIGSKRFIKAHLKYSIQSSSFAAHHWVFYATRKKVMVQCSLPSLFDNTFTHPIICNADLGIDSKSETAFPVGYCNGLVCIVVNRKRFILWNPTTKKFNNLPEIKVECGSFWGYGFGFDELSDDFKIFGILYSFYTRDCIGMVYSLSSNSWKHIDETDHDSAFGDKGWGKGMYVSGKLHWCDCENGDIVSFDLNRHVYGVVELPSYTKGVRHGLGVVGGCLSTHVFHPNGDLIVSVMKEYGVKESWNKMVTIPYNLPDFPVLVALIAITPNGEVLLINGAPMTIVIYDPKCNVLRYPMINGLGKEFNIIDSFGIYIESLASVAPDAQ